MIIFVFQVLENKKFHYILGVNGLEKDRRFVFERIMIYSAFVADLSSVFFGNTMDLIFGKTPR